MSINEFYKIIKSWLGSNVVTSESFDRHFHSHGINVVQNNLGLISIKEILTLQWLPLQNQRDFATNWQILQYTMPENTWRWNRLKEGPVLQQALPHLLRAVLWFFSFTFLSGLSPKFWLAITTVDFNQSLLDNRKISHRRPLITGRFN